MISKGSISYTYLALHTGRWGHLRSAQRCWAPHGPPWSQRWCDLCLRDNILSIGFFGEYDNIISTCPVMSSNSLKESLSEIWSIIKCHDVYLSQATHSETYSLASVDRKVSRAYLLIHTHNELKKLVHLCFYYNQLDTGRKPPYKTGEHKASLPLGPLCRPVNVTYHKHGGSSMTFSSEMNETHWDHVTFFSAVRHPGDYQCPATLFCRSRCFRRLLSKLKSLHWLAAQFPDNCYPSDLSTRRSRVA